MLLHWNYQGLNILFIGGNFGILCWLGLTNKLLVSNVSKLNCWSSKFYLKKKVLVTPRLLWYQGLLQCFSGGGDLHRLKQHNALMVRYRIRRMFNIICLEYNSHHLIWLSIDASIYHVVYIFTWKIFYQQQRIQYCT